MESKLCSLWFAFDTLDVNGRGDIQRSQLKVLLANIGNLLGLTSAESDLESFMSDQQLLDFDAFCTYLQKHVFVSLPECDAKSFEKMSASIDEMCWALCKKDVMRSVTMFRERDVYKLFRVINVVAEIVPDQLRKKVVATDKEEVENVTKEFIAALGKPWTDALCDGFRSGAVNYSFQEFLHLLETDVTSDVRKVAISEAVNEVCDAFIKGVIKKGVLKKKGPTNVATWKERWFVLQPNKISYYVDREEQILKGVIPLSSESRIALAEDKKSSYPNRFIITPVNDPKARVFEISAIDNRTRQEWLAAVQLAIENSEDVHLFQRKQFERRKQRRDEQLEREEKEFKQKCQELQAKDKALEEERLKREAAEAKAEQETLRLQAQIEKQREEEEGRLRQQSEKVEMTQSELEAERQARLEAEERARQEAAIAEAERHRREELEMIHVELQRLLKDERQAKKDEETVRTLQANLLEQESAKRQELEGLREKQDALLHDERQKREDVERNQEDIARLLQEERKRLQELELERLDADYQLKEALKKLEMAEETKQRLEAARKEREKPVGLSRLIQPRANPLITHRGLGAFCDLDFLVKKEDIGGTAGIVIAATNEPTNDEVDADGQGQVAPSQAVTARQALCQLMSDASVLSKSNEQVKQSPSPKPRKRKGEKKSTQEESDAGDTTATDAKTVTTHDNIGTNSEIGGGPASVATDELLGDINDPSREIGMNELYDRIHQEIDKIEHELYSGGLTQQMSFDVTEIEDVIERAISDYEEGDKSRSSSFLGGASFSEPHELQANPNDGEHAHSDRSVPSTDILSASAAKAALCTGNGNCFPDSGDSLSCLTCETDTSELVPGEKIRVKKRTSELLLTEEDQSNLPIRQAATESMFFPDKDVVDL